MSPQPAYLTPAQRHPGRTLIPSVKKKYTQVTFPVWNDLDEFHKIVSAVRKKEKEARISMRKLRTWLGWYREMSFVCYILRIELEWKNHSGWWRRLMMLYQFRVAHWM